MDVSPRRTRAQRKQQDALISTTTATDKPTSKATPSLIKPSPAIYYKIPNLPNFTAQPTLIPPIPSKQITKLPPADHKLLLHKQSLLKEINPHLPGSVPKVFLKHTAGAIGSTLIFAREEAGTAVIIREDGLILTCAHCIAETTEEFEVENAKSKLFWLIQASGRIVSARCIAWDPVRDLALLGVVSASESDSEPGASVVPSDSRSNPAKDKSVDIEVDSSKRTWTFQVISLAENSPPQDIPLICIGHPGSEDLETAKRGVKTNYDVLHISRGFFRGIADGQDIQNNEEIGALMHDCWTYWGHSGAPLLDRQTGKLVGLHSSWDDETGMRRGVAVEALREFLRLCGMEL